MALTEREAQILKILRDNPMVSREQLAGKLGISASAVGTHLHNLTAKGHILGRGYIVPPEKQVAVVGGSNIDLKATARGDYLSGTSNPGFFHESIGGVARNIAENLGLLGVPVALFTAVGDDQYGKSLLERTWKPSLDLTFVIRSNQYRTGMYLAHLNGNGILQGAIADMEVMAEIDPDYLFSHRRILENSSFLIFDTNIDRDSINCLLDLVAERDITVLAEPVSVAKSTRLQGRLNEIDIITPNLDEALTIMDLDGPSLSFGEEFLPQPNGAATAMEQPILKSLISVYQQKGFSTTFVISLGREGVLVLSPEDHYLLSAAEVPAEEIVEETGAGDALTAGIVYGLLKGNGLREAVGIGIHAAAVTLKNKYTVNPRLKEELAAITSLRGLIR